MWGRLLFPCLLSIFSDTFLSGIFYSKLGRGKFKCKVSGNVVDPFCIVWFIGVIVRLL